MRDPRTVIPLFRARPRHPEFARVHERSWALSVLSGYLHRDIERLRKQSERLHALSRRHRLRVVGGGELSNRVGPGGFEPPLTDPKSAVLPLDEGPESQACQWLATTRETSSAAGWVRKWVRNWQRVTRSALWGKAPSHKSRTRSSRRVEVG